jgi:hypothetical protein
MKKVHEAIIKNECLRYAADNELKIVTLSPDFKAENDCLIVDVPLTHIYNLVVGGWGVADVLENETNLKHEPIALD